MLNKHAASHRRMPTKVFPGPSILSAHCAPETHGFQPSAFSLNPDPYMGPADTACGPWLLLTLTSPGMFMRPRLLTPGGQARPAEALWAELAGEFTFSSRSHRPASREPPQAAVRSMMLDPARVPTPTATCKFRHHVTASGCRCVGGLPHQSSNTLLDLGAPCWILEQQWEQQPEQSLVPSDGA